MSLNEILISLIGLVVGWVIVSRVMSVKRGAIDDLSSEEWFEVLGVPSTASIEQIDAAYAGKQRLLQESMPAITTVTEEQSISQKRGILDAAYYQGKIHARNRGRMGLS